MSHIDKHEQGEFSWIELGTTDQNAARFFYSSLLGWDYTDHPMGPNDFYTMFERNGRSAAGGYTLRPEQIAQGVPPHWNLYIAVEDVTPVLARATELGASILAGPFDVFTLGRMAVLSDPTGAVFSLWEPRSHTGVGIRDEQGALCWADLSTSEPERGARFYADLFGYKLTPGAEGYQHIKNGIHFIGGVPPVEFRNPNAPPHWLIYLQVDDCAERTRRAQELGASVYMGPTAINNVGLMTVLADPQGAVFALFQPTPHSAPG